MNEKWIVLMVTIELMAIGGVIGALVTKNLRAPFLFGFNTLLPVTAVYCWYGDGSTLRQALLLILVSVYLLRMNVVLTAWYSSTAAVKLKDTLPPAQLYTLPIILANVFGWLYCLPFNWAASRSGALSWIDLSALIVYVLGTVLHLGSDYQKRRFKQQPGTRGRILDTGFWRYSRHPNYLGDLLIYCAFGIMAGNLWGLVAPLANLAQYAGDAIPKGEKMAAERYGQAWSDYKRRTRCLVPFII